MELDTIAGLPAHPLIVHVPVVLIPVVALLAAVFALLPRTRRVLGLPLVVLTAGVTFATILAAGSGESLEERVDRSSLIHEHAEAGELLRALMLVLFVAIVVAVALDRRGRSSHGDAVARLGRSRGAGLAIGAVLLVLAAGATAMDVRAGHLGAKAAWHDLPAAGEDGGGDDDD